MSFVRALLSGPFLRVSRLAAFGAHVTVVTLVTLTLNGCAGLFGGDSLHVNVAGVEPLASQGLEMRFNLKLRVQNPNDSTLSFNGISVDLDLNGRPFASGVSDQGGSVPRFAESVISVPVTVPAFTAVGQALALPGAVQSGQIPYTLRGKLAGGLTGTTRFVDQGTLKLPLASMGLQ